MTPLIVLTDSDTSTHSLEPPKKKTRKKRINEGASSRWSFGPHSACGSKESTAILITHSSFGSSSSDEDEIISDALSHQIQRCRDAEKQINRLRVAQLRRQRRLMAKNKKLQEKNLDLRRKLKKKSQNVHNQMCAICFDSESNQHLSHVATHSVSNVPMEYLLMEYRMENAQIAVRSFIRKIFDNFISPRHWICTYIGFIIALLEKPIFFV